MRKNVTSAWYHSEEMISVETKRGLNTCLFSIRFEQAVKNFGAVAASKQKGYRYQSESTILNITILKAVVRECILKELITVHVNSFLFLCEIMIAEPTFDYSTISIQYSACTSDH